MLMRREQIAVGVLTLLAVGLVAIALFVVGGPGPGE
jgi:hypothetical protein